LDTLRGYAILGVIFYHCAYFSGWNRFGVAFTEAGAFGVQLFFMVSAFTIFMTLERSVSRETAPVRSFFIRRLFRIVPMFWLGIILYSFIPGREHYYSDWKIGASYYFLTAALQHGWHPNYINTVVPGGWSIGIEATFYIIAPWLFFWIKNWWTALGFFLATLVLYLSANTCVHLLQAHQLIFKGMLPDLSRRFMHQWFPSQLPVFACGIFAYRTLKAMPETMRSKRNGLLVLAAAVMFLFSVVGISDHRLIPTQVFFALGFLLLVVALAIYPLRLLVNPAICGLGRISYSCYLMHFGIMLALMPQFSFFSRLFFSHSLKAYVVLFGATVVLTVLVSLITYNVIEQPFIRLGAYLAHRLNSASELPLKNPVTVA
jgi:peptidoglycan/LPS O-acetylase OafA/YrhL